MKFVLKGKPLVFKRPVHTRWKVFDPLEKEKKAAKWELIYQCPQVLYTSVAIHMDVVFYLVPPKTGKNKKAKYHSIRPDIDNMLKPLFDICTSIIWNDDCIVSSITAKKVYDFNSRTEFSFTILKDSNEPNQKKD